MNDVTINTKSELLAYLKDELPDDINFNYIRVEVTPIKGGRLVVNGKKTDIETVYNYSIDLIGNHTTN